MLGVPVLRFLHVLGAEKQACFILLHLVGPQHRWEHVVQAYRKELLGVLVLLCPLFSAPCPLFSAPCPLFSAGCHGINLLHLVIEVFLRLQMPAAWDLVHLSTSLATVTVDGGRWGPQLSLLSAEEM